MFHLSNKRAEVGEGGRGVRADRSMPPRAAPPRQDAPIEDGVAETGDSVRIGSYELEWQ